MRLSFIIYIIIARLFVGSLLFAQSKQPAIIPEPYELNVVEKGSFSLKDGIKVFLETNDSKIEAAVKNLSFVDKASLIEIVKEEKNANFIISLEKNQETSDEGYCLKIEPKLIKLVASKNAGLFYGLKTIEQIINLEWKNKRISCLTIKDQPRFSYRGVMIDVSRHFFTANEIKRMIDIMSKLKFNYFHWHLVDNEGWRIEIKKYPELTTVGARHNGYLTSEKGFFYSQEEIRDLVRYAEDRFIEIVPEIEMPGHSMEVLQIMKHLQCPGATNSRVFCAGNDNTFLFLKDVISEVVELFPGKYIHIGGDEADKTTWKACSLCQDRIRCNKLKNEHELQSYFVKRIEEFIVSKGKKMLGWSEILEGGLAPSATVMSWLGEESALEAANSGHDAILTPKQKCYLDMAQGDFYTEPPSWVTITSLKAAYEYDFLLKNLDVTKKHHLLGGQACLWSECIPNESHLQYMAFPRLFAISESLWTPIQKKNYSYFVCRLLQQFNILEKQHVNFRFPHSVFHQQINNTVILDAEIPSNRIYYRLSFDGKKMGKTFCYKKPFQTKMPVLIEAGTKQRNKSLPKSRYIMANFIDPEQIKVIGVSSNSKDSSKAIDLFYENDVMLHDNLFPTWTRWETQNNKPPHSITIDLGKEENLSGFAYYPRRDGIDGQPNKTGNILRFNVWAGNELNNLTKLNFNGKFSGERQPEMAVFEPIKVRYLKIIIEDGVSGKATIADLRFFKN